MSNDVVEPRDEAVEVHFIETSGEERRIEIPVGRSLMEGALAGGVEGLLADCGGACSCATCHVYIDPEWVDRIPLREPMESDMLECAEHVRSNSRLSCQIIVTSDLAGLRAEVAEIEH